MNRRRWLLALAMAAPLAMFVVAKVAASWRPVKLASLSNQSTRYEVVTAENIVDVNGRTFDLKSGGEVPLTGPLLGVDGWNWGWVEDGQSGQRPALILKNRADEEFFYSLPQGVDTTGFSQSLVRLSPAEDRVELVFAGRYYRWSQSSRRLQRNVDLKKKNGLFALARDGQSLVHFDSRTIEWRSTLDGKVTKRLVLPGFRVSNGSPGDIEFSRYGSYALCRTFTSGVVSYHWELIDLRAGRVLRVFHLSSIGERGYFSRDESQIAVPKTARRVWEIRALPDGRVLQTLPLVADTRGGAFSPDNATLYSVAGGTLYRQRAR